MNRIITIVIVVLLLAAVVSAGCIGAQIRGSGNLKTETYDLGDFDKVDIGYAFKVNIVQDGYFKVEVTADDNVFKYIRVTKMGNTLRIQVDPVTLIGSPTLEADISMPKLTGLEFSGATSGTVSGFDSADDLDLDLSGASSLDLNGITAGDIKFDVSGASKADGDLYAGNIDFDVSGASTVKLEGSGADIVIDGSGASNVDLEDFEVNNADVALSGASKSIVNLTGKLDADLSGASNLKYIGEPAMGTVNTSGGSNLSKK